MTSITRQDERQIRLERWGGLVATLRERVLQGPCTPVGWRLLGFCRGAKEHEGGPLIARRAAGFARTIEIFPAQIHDDELIVGTHHFGEQAGIDGAIDFPDMNPHLMCGDTSHLKAQLEKISLSAQQREEILSLCGRRELFATAYSGPEKPEEVRLAEEAGLIFGFGLSLNHSVRDYARVLRLGYEGIAAQIETELAQVQIDNPEDLPRMMFLQAARTLVTGCIQMGHKYAAQARELAQSATEPRRSELLEIAQVCDQVPARPARTFREAAQSLWLAHVMTCAEDHINANSFGRIDQILGSYYEADLAAGRIDEAEALILLKHLWLKLWRDYDVQQMQLGGLTREGKDATNAVSILALQATEEIGLVRCLAVRLHNETPRQLLERAVDLVSKGGGVPFFFNDDAIIPALLDKGIALEDARDYAVIGCVEVTIPGKTSPHAVSHNTNLARCFELALHNGVNPATGLQVGPQTGDVAEFTGIEDVWQAYCAQAEHVCRVGAWQSNAGQLDQMQSWPKVYESILTDDCIQRGRDLNAGGAVYNYHSVSCIGIPNVADSLWAIEKLVFTDNVITLPQLVKILDTNFENNEDFRLMLLNRIEKYGNDCTGPDTWAARVSEHICDTLGNLRTWFGGSFHAHLFSFLWNVNPFGNVTGALPDGRKAGEPLAYSLSATAGRDRQGITAFFNSLSRIPHHKAAGSSSAIVELAPSFFEGEGREKFVSVMEAAVAAGVGQMQFNVVSADRLRKAQTDPERYGNIIVRVSGFSQEFRLVDKPLQDHIINRTKHAE